MLRDTLFRGRELPRRSAKLSWGLASCNINFLGGCTRKSIVDGVRNWIQDLRRDGEALYSLYKCQRPKVNIW